VSDSYSRKELQGWGDTKKQIVRSELSFTNHEITATVKTQFSGKVLSFVEILITGLGYPLKKDLDVETPEHLLLQDMYEDLQDISLKYISVLEKDKKKSEKLLWDNIEQNVIDNAKKYLAQQYSNDILTKFNSKISSIVYNYTAHLPKHVVSSEFDDLANIAKIEFIETIKDWDFSKKKDVWSLAYQRIRGAMKDHIRYLTKADPGRLYDWITNAAYIYLTVNNNNNYETKIENNVQLNEAMKSLSHIEKAIVNNRYKNDKTFKDIGLEVNLSESQVTRIYKEAIRKIKKIVEDNK
jgi:RNA polymerase sigma factor (sigma-70 family)